MKKLRKALVPCIVFYLVAFLTVQTYGMSLTGWTLWPRTMEQMWVDVLSLFFGGPLLALSSLYVALQKADEDENCANQRGSIVLGDQAGRDITR